MLIFIFFTQGSWSGCSDPGRGEDATDGSADPAADAPDSSPDRLWYGIPGLTPLRAQRPGNQKLPGRWRSRGEDRRLRHVQRHLQHWLLQGRFPFPFISAVCLLDEIACLVSTSEFLKGSSGVVFIYYSWSLITHVSGWWKNHATYSLDASWEYHVQKVHHREWHLEFWGGSVGDLHLRKTAVVSAVQQRGTPWKHTEGSRTLGKTCIFSCILLHYYNVFIL